ncbi:hypothetical protein FRC17_003327 [Serendipita sp. 399]|nr:hypothetical protein FRC17_003327 [Serendipita sp. 399]
MLFTETPTGSISKDIAYPELSIQSPQYTAQADRGTSVLPPYAVPLRGIALSGPCSPLGFLDGGDRHDWSQILASLDCYGSNETNSLTSFAQPLGSDDPTWLPEPLPVDPPSPLAVRNALPSTGSNPATKYHQKRQAGLSIVDIATLSRAFTDQSPHPDTTRRTLLDEILRSSFYLENEHEPQLSTLEADIILVMAGLDPLADCVTRKGSIYSLLINAVTMACLICDKTHGTTNRALGCVRKHLGHRPFVCKGMRDRCRNCLESWNGRWLTVHILYKSNAHVRLGGIRRHYKTMHPFEPFPDMKAERKRAKRELELSSTSSVLVGRE